MMNLLVWNTLFSATAAPHTSSADFRPAWESSMRIGRICRPRFPSHSKNQAIRLGVFAVAAGLVLVPTLAQGPLGASAAAAGAAAAASSAAPAPKKSAASAAAQTSTNSGNTPPQTEEAQIGAVSGGLGSPAAPAPPLKGVAAQCANLLKMATDLKSEVDKTTKDVLSLSVVREAGQIEETAKKMRQQQH